MVDFAPARLKALKEKLAARRGMKGFEENVRQLEAEIARIENTAPAVTPGTIETIDGAETGNTVAPNTGTAKPE